MNEKWFFKFGQYTKDERDNAAVSVVTDTISEQIRLLIHEAKLGHSSCKRNIAPKNKYTKICFTLNRQRLFQNNARRLLGTVL